MALNPDQLEAALERLIEAFESSSGRLGGASNTASRQLVSAAQNSQFAANAFKAVTGSSATLQNVQGQQYKIGQALVKNLLQLTNASIQATQALYGIAPGLTGYMNTFNQSVSALNTAVNGVLVGSVLTLNPFIAGLGITVKALHTAITPLITAAGMLMKLMDQQINAYRQANEVGAIFGGSLGRMQLAAQSAGVSVDMLGKVTRDNAESIAKTGLSMSLGSAVVAQYSQTIARSDRGLVSLYGSTEELAKGTADYLALQAQLGRTDLNNQKANETGIKEYLRTQKELSDITGKRTSQLKAEEEERRRNLAYTLKLGRLGDDAKRNVTEGMAVATRIFGQEGAKYAQEYFATGGQVYSKEALRFQAMMPEAAGAIAEMVTATDESSDQYRKKIGAYLDANKEALATSAKQLETFAEINFGANNPILTAMTTVGASILNNAQLLNNYNDLVKKAVDERATLEKGTIVVRIGKDQYKEIIDPTIELVNTIEKQRLDNQLKIDAIITRNMQDMTGLVQGLGLVQDAQIAITGYLADATGTIVAKITEAVKIFRSTPGREDPSNPPPSSEIPTVNLNGPLPTSGRAVPVVVLNQQNRTPNPPTPGAAGNTLNPGEGMATGGVTRGPTLAGEDGPEAVIPLAKGAVPMNIDWRPLIAAIDNQSTLTEDLIKAVNDSKDIQQRMLQSMG